MAGQTRQKRLCLSLACLTMVAACQRPLPEPVPVDLLPLTVEQVLPDAVPATAVYERSGCYYYRAADRFVPIATRAAPDGPQPYC